MPTLHDVFRATFRIDEFVHIESDWTFRVFDDGTLTVEIQRPDDWRERLLTQDPPADLERFERELVYSYVSYDGTATRIVAGSPDASNNTSGFEVGYSCQFYLAKCGAEGESWTVEITGTLSATNGLQCHWRHECQQEYALWRPRFEEEESHVVPAPSAWQASAEPVVATLVPLTVGSYLLEGSLMDDENYGFIVPITMELILHADSSVTGTSVSAWGSTRDDGKQEVAELSGTWTRDSVELIQSFAFPDDPDEVFAFYGRVGPYMIAGEWAVVELEALEDWEDSERQRFHLRVTKMLRRWSPEEHAYFADTFRTAARLCLLSSVRQNGSSVRLPSVLWPHVLSFCDSEWFAPDKETLKRADERRVKAPV